MMSSLGDCGKREAFWGALVINRQERTLPAERFWGGFYEELLREKGDRAWVATDKNTVEWFLWFCSNLASCESTICCSSCPSGGTSSS